MAEAIIPEVETPKAPLQRNDAATKVPVVVLPLYPEADTRAQIAEIQGLGGDPYHGERLP